MNTPKKITCKLAAGIALAVALFPTQHAAADPTPFGTNSYEFVLVDDPFSASNNTWATAAAAAATRLFEGASGHLADVTSLAENDFLLGLTTSGNFNGFRGAWLGGKAPEGWLVGPEAGQAFSYTNWGGIEPNNAGFAYMNIGTAAPVGQGQWADSATDGIPDPSYNPVVGYFVEYDNVPEPSTALLAVIGFVSIFCSRRIRYGCNA